MRLLVQRVKRAEVRVAGAVAGAVAGRIGQGLLVFVGFGQQDGPGLPAEPQWAKMQDKLLGLRIFPDAGGKLNVSLRDAAGGLLLVPQFTLYADCRQGRRPSFSGAARPDIAKGLFDRLAEDIRRGWPHGQVECGVFGADMEVELVNWGPVTIWLDGAELAV